MLRLRFKKHSDNYIKNLGHQPGGISALAVSNQVVIASAKDANDIKIWNAITGDNIGILKESTAQIKNLAISDKNNLIASTDEKGDKIILWKVSDMKKLLIINCRKQVTALAFAPGEKLLALGEKNGEVQLVELPSGEEKGILSVSSELVNKSDTPPRMDIKQLAISVSGNHLAALYGFESIVSIWKLRDKQLSTDLMVIPYKPFSICFSPDNNYLLVTGFSMKLEMNASGDITSLSNIKGGILVRELSSGITKMVTADKMIFPQGAWSTDGKNITVLALFPTPRQGQAMAALYTYPLIKILEKNLGNPINKVNLNNVDLFESISSSAFSPSGSHFAMYAKQNLFLYGSQI
jgi:WD40 repeat protein